MTELFKQEVLDRVTGLLDAEQLDLVETALYECSPDEIIRAIRKTLFKMEISADAHTHSFKYYGYWRAGGPMKNVNLLARCECGQETGMGSGWTPEQADAKGLKEYPAP